MAGKWEKDIIRLIKETKINMELKALVCPQCGGQLNLTEMREFVYCPHCGNQIYLDIGGNKSKGREFKTPEGILVGKAELPEDYKTEAVIQQGWLSETVPQVSYMRAVSGDERQVIVSASKETLFDIRSKIMQGMLGLIQTHTKNGYVKFIEEVDYCKRWAEQITGVELVPTAQTVLHSALGDNPGLAASQLQSELGTYFSYLGEQYPVVNSEAHSRLFRFTGVYNGQNVVVLAGCDWNGAELGGNQIMSNISGALKNIMDNNPELKKSVGDFKSTFSDVMSGREKMTMSDWMHGGILGVMKRNKQKQANEVQSPEPQAEPQKQLNPDGSIPFGHSQEFGKAVSFIVFGSQRRYATMFPAEDEEKATKIFMEFVKTLESDSMLAQRENEMVQQKIRQVMQEAANNQAMAQQMQMRTLQMQQQTSQMIARNSAQTSAGIMDSWEKRQASQSRISNNYSEAIRGVNTYTTPTGANVEVGVVADHAYQNQYGDIIGVSGNAPDNSTLNDLNWTELTKK